MSCLVEETIHIGGCKYGKNRKNLLRKRLALLALTTGIAVSGFALGNSIFHIKYSFLYHNTVNKYIFYFSLKYISHFMLYRYNLII